MKSGRPSFGNGWMILFGLLASSLFITSGFAQSAPLPAVDDIKLLYADGQYRQTLAACLRVINLRDDSYAGYDRHPVRMMCAECQLRLKMTKAAGETLDAAAATAMQSANPTDAAEAKALALLIRDSVGGYYIPKTGHIRERLDILDPSNRQSAYLALFNDRFEWCKQQQHKSAADESLAPALELAKTFDGVRAVEQISTQSTVQCDGLADQLATCTNTMVRNVLTSYDRQIDQIVRDTNVGANRKVHRGRQVPLNTQQTEKLQQVLSDCQKVPDAIDELNTAFAQPVAATADDDRAHAQNTVDRIKAIFAENDRVTASQENQQNQARRVQRVY